MTKYDLKEFDIVKLRDGRECIVLFNDFCDGLATFDKSIIGCITYLKNYCHNMISTEDKQCDIVAVSKYKGLCIFSRVRDFFKGKEITDWDWERKEEIKVGDIVKVTDIGKCYITHCEWFKRNHIDIELAARYKYNETPNNKFNYEVMCIVDNIALIQKENYWRYDECYLIGLDGLEREDKKWQLKIH